MEENEHAATRVGPLHECSTKDFAALHFDSFRRFLDVWTILRKLLSKAFERLQSALRATRARLVKDIANKRCFLSFSLPSYSTVFPPRSVKLCERGTTGILRAPSQEYLHSRHSRVVCFTIRWLVFVCKLAKSLGREAEVCCS